VGEEGLILHSKDGGIHWRPQNSGTAARLLSICGSDSQLWVVGGRRHHPVLNRQWRPLATETKWDRVRPVLGLCVAKKEADRKRIEAAGIRDFQQIVTPGISPNFLRWKGIEATLDLAKSANAKVIVIGAQTGLPLILDTSSSALANPETPLQPKPTASPYQEPAVEKINSSSSTNPGLLVPVPVATPAPVLSAMPEPLTSPSPAAARTTQTPRSKAVDQN
jgi:hypothetical protein